jgi:hypothetical protein
MSAIAVLDSPSAPAVSSHDPPWKVIEDVFAGSGLPCTPPRCGTHVLDNQKDTVSKSIVILQGSATSGSKQFFCVVSKRVNGWTVSPGV